MAGAQSYKVEHWLHRLLPRWRVARPHPAIPALPINGHAPAETAIPQVPALECRGHAEQRIAHFILPDDLVVLANRAAILERLERSIARVRQATTGGAAGGLAVLYLDLDRLSRANDTRSYPVSDLMLMEVATRMQASMREGDTVGHIGGNEFAVVFPGVSTIEQAGRSAQRLAALIREPCVLNEGICRVDVSIGVALFPQDGNTAEELLRRADSALHRAKSAGHGLNTRKGPQAALDDARLLQEDLELALERDQFEMTYQPIFDTNTKTPIAFEAAVQWRHPNRGIVPASVFIPICERSDLIQKLGRWVMHTACTEAATWAMPVRLAINLSPAQFRRDDLEHQVIETLHRSGLAPERLDLEVTASALQEHSQQVLATMLSLRTLGVRLVLDDFGQANAALNSLRDFAFQQIKISPSYIATMLTDPLAMASVRAVLQMALEAQVDVVADGVESQAQLDILTHLECGQIQGALLGAPKSPEQARKYLWQATRRTEGDSMLLVAE
jgi:diguanylate cyclase (GGDEF)-like protein